MDSGLISRYSAKFVSKSEEKRFREYTLTSDRNQSGIGIALLMVTSFFFTLSDYCLFSFSSRFFLVASIRMAHFMICLGVVVSLFKTRSVRFYDISIFFLGIITTFLVIYITSTRPANYTSYIYFCIVMNLFIYLVLNNTLYYQLAAGIFFASMNIGSMIFQNKSITQLEMNALVSTYILVNVMGAVISLRFNRLRRKEFFALQEEKSAKAELQRALDNVKTLHGLLPICSCCKKVRDDKGYWNQIDEYLSSHSDLLVSHSLCDDCARKLYPNIKI